ncbi:MAG: hypothetical protein JWN43_3230 [Gammaproteobacteria bacterium]|nr:hypothetical protein [Gammaproteobacteria bacterium]
MARGTHRRSGRSPAVGLRALPLLAAAVWAGIAASPELASASPEPASAGRARERQSFEAVCGKCHNLQLVADTPRDLDAWQDTVQKMADRGAHGTDAQFDDVMAYLHRNLTTIDVNTADADELATVLDVPDATANAIVTRRTARKFSGLDDLKSVPGVDPSVLDAKARLIFF